MDWLAIRENIVQFWQSGGMMMIPIGILCFFIYYTIWELWIYMKDKSFSVVSLDVVDRWVFQPEQSVEDVREIIEYALVHDGVDEFDIRERLKEVRNNYLPYVDRRLIFLGVVISAAPLMGLLGTVTGMFVTFSGLTFYAGRSIDIIARGISEALITTQTGLLIAIPAYALLFIIYRKRNEWMTFFSLLECALLRRRKS
jgi:biopolymer transport protein ExbB